MSTGSGAQNLTPESNDLAKKKVARLGTLNVEMDNWEIQENCGLSGRIPERLEMGSSSIRTTSTAGVGSGRSKIRYLLSKE